MMIDTGEELDVVYTTDSLVVATPIDGHTSIMISKLKDELPCNVPTNEDEDRTAILIVYMVVTTLVLAKSVYVVVVHLMFKQLRNLMGKLLLLYCLIVATLTVTAQIHFPMLYDVNRPQTACQFITITLALVLKLSPLACYIVLRTSCTAVASCM